MKPFVILSALVIMATTKPAFGQTEFFKHNGYSVMAFETELGQVTVDHAIGFPADLRSQDLDIAIRFRKGKAFYRFGSGEPDYFIDRRGTTHRISVVKTERNQWIVDIEFFSGESGLPVFNRKGLVVGMVLGNIVPEDLGRVCRLDRFRIFQRLRRAVQIPKSNPTPQPDRTGRVSADLIIIGESLPD